MSSLAAVGYDLVVDSNRKMNFTSIWELRILDNS